MYISKQLKTSIFICCWQVGMLPSGRIAGESEPEAPTESGSSSAGCDTMKETVLTLTACAQIEKAGLGEKK